MDVMLYSVQHALIYIMRGTACGGPAVRALAYRARGATPSPCSLYEKRPPTRARDVGFAISSRSGQQVVEMPTYPLQLTCLGVIYGTPALAAVFVALRIYTRRKLNLRLSWGRYCAIVSMCASC
jgi:hypothetical protein